MNYSVRNIQKKYHNLHEGNPYMQMLEKKLNDELNNFCVECGNENPEYISINNGIFICVECVQNHFRFPKNISRIINNNIKSLTLDEIQFLLCGGNRALLDFINNEFPKLSEYPPNILYRTQAMVYYRQNLQYLINGGIAPIKPNLKYAYKVSNFINNLQSEFSTMKENISNNYNMSENETYNTIQEERRLLSNINNFNEFENYAKFNQSNYNFRKVNDRIININTNNCSRGKNYDNYIRNKPRQVNFQNNNNIIIGNLNTNNELTEIKEIKETQMLNCQKPKNKRKFHNALKESTNFLNNLNEVYVKPKLVLSPKVNINCLTINGTLSQRNINLELNKKTFNHNDNNDININEINNNNNDDKYLIKKKLNKNSSQDLYIMTQNQFFDYKTKKGRYIHKSLSQRDIKDEEYLKNKNNNKKKYNINTNEKEGIISKIKEMKNMNKKNNGNIFNNNNNTNYNYEINQLYTLNNQNFVTENNQRLTNEVESLPIKINLKNRNNKDNRDKSKDSHKNKKLIINEKNYFSSDESKIKDDNNPINKKINREKLMTNNNINNRKEKEKDNISEKNDKNNKSNLCKHLSQSNITKDSKDRNKKLLGDKVINPKEINKVSIRNKYKLKRKNQF